jgi:hypothetical protein
MKKFALAAILVVALVSVAYAQTTLPSPAISVGQGDSVTFTWVAPTKRSDGTALTGALSYNLYSVTATGSSLLQAGITGTSNIRQNLNVGTPCYSLTAVEAGGGESAQTPPICVQIVSKPALPTGWTVTVTVKSAP